MTKNMRLGEIENNLFLELYSCVKSKYYGNNLDRVTEKIRNTDVVCRQNIERNVV